jgi:hypothetical protein
MITRRRFLKGFSGLVPPEITVVNVQPPAAAAWSQ